MKINEVKYNIKKESLYLRMVNSLNATFEIKKIIKK